MKTNLANDRNLLWRLNAIVIGHGNMEFRIQRFGDCLRIHHQVFKSSKVGYKFHTDTADRAGRLHCKSHYITATFVQNSNVWVKAVTTATSTTVNSGSTKWFSWKSIIFLIIQLAMELTNIPQVSAVRSKAMYSTTHWIQPSLTPISTCSFTLLHTHKKIYA